MKNIAFKQVTLYIFIPFLSIFLMASEAVAQRFAHGSVTVRTYRPVPAARPVPVRPVPVRPVPVRPVPVPVRPVPVPVPVRPVPVPAWHYPYYYHPFVPYYWGPAWYPVGFFVATVATTAIIVTIANEEYHYDEGVYYQKSGDGYKVVPAPIGAEISDLPDGYTKLDVDGKTYYYYGGAYYVKSSSKYKVVAPPAGAVVTKLPEGAKETTVDGKKYVEYNGTFYQPISQNGQDAYVVTETKTEEPKTDDTKSQK